jgi:hypothetical protein
MTIDEKSTQRFAAMGLGTHAQNRIAEWEAKYELVLSGRLLPLTGTSMKECILKSITESTRGSDEWMYSTKGVFTMREQLLDLERDLAAFCRGEFPEFNCAANWEADWNEIPLQTRQALLNASSIKLADTSELDDVRMWCGDYLINGAARLLAPGGFSELIRYFASVTLDTTDPVLLETPNCMMAALGMPLTEEFRVANPYVAATLDGTILNRNLILLLFVWNILLAMYGSEVPVNVCTQVTRTSVKRDVEIRKELGQTLGEDDIAELVKRRTDLRCVQCGITRSALKARAGGGSLAGCSGCAEHSADSLQTSPVVYCSKECQKAHWKVHKPVCGKTRAALLRYSDGSLRSRALVRQIEQLQSKELADKGVDYILFTDSANNHPDIGITHSPANPEKELFQQVRTCAFTYRHAPDEVLCLYEMLKAQLPDFGGIFTDAELRSQLKAEYGFDPLELVDTEAVEG